MQELPRKAIVSRACPRQHGNGLRAYRLRVHGMSGGEGIWTITAQWRTGEDW